MSVIATKCLSFIEAIKYAKSNFFLGRAEKCFPSGRTLGDFLPKTPDSRGAAGGVRRNFDGGRKSGDKRSARFGSVNLFPTPGDSRPPLLDISRRQVKVSQTFMALPKNHLVLILLIYNQIELNIIIILVLIPNLLTRVEISPPVITSIKDCTNFF